MDDTQKHKYTLSYTIFDVENKIFPKPEHKKYTFESESDIVTAVDEGACQVYENYSKSHHLGDAEYGVEIMFRSISLDDPKEYYEKVRQWEADRLEKHREKQ